MKNKKTTEYYHKYRELFYPGGTRDEEAFRLLSFLIAEGYTDNMIATYYGVSRQSIGNWKREHEEIYQCFAENKSTPDDKVEMAMFELATGYQLIETKVNVVDGSIKLTDVVKQIPPNGPVGMWWLQNRRSDKWKSVVHNVNSETPPAPEFNYENLTEAEMDMYEKLLRKITPEPAKEEEE